MADVSVVALHKVKSALSAFQSDIAGISFRASTQTQNCLNVCNQKIAETQTKLSELDTEMNQLTKLIIILYIFKIGDEVNIIRSSGFT